jgi:hypothetical protein
MDDTEDPDMTLYAREPINDSLGDGFRLYDSHDNAYEMRIDNGFGPFGEVFETRLYSEDGQWHAKLRIPETEPEEAYKKVKELAGQIDDRYGFEPLMPAPEFHSGGRYSIDGDIDGIWYFNDSEQDSTVKELDDREEALLVFGGTGLTVGYMFGGLVAGGTAGSAFGPPGGVIGAVIGGVGGAGAGFADILGGCEGHNTPTNLASKAPGKLRDTVRHRREEKQRKADTVSNSDFLNDLNRKRSIEPDYEGTTDWELKEEYEQLEEKDLDQRLQDTLDAAFHCIQQTPGLHLTASFDQYQDATEFLATVQDADAPGADRLSIYDNPAIFRQIFTHARDDDRKTLTQNVTDHGTENVEQYLEDNHRDILINLANEN